MTPKPENPAALTAFDVQRLESAKAKRERKNAKRLADAMLAERGK